MTAVDRRVEQLEAERDHRDAEITRVRARVAALHHPVTLMGQVWCDECSTQRLTGPSTCERIAYIPHPCRTIQALTEETS